MSEVYFSNSNLLIRSMEVDDAKIIYDTYLSYGWHPSLETYDNYYKEQEENKRIYLPTDLPILQGKARENTGRFEKIPRKHRNRKMPKKPAILGI